LVVERGPNKTLFGHQPKIGREREPSIGTDAALCLAPLRPRAAEPNNQAAVSPQGVRAQAKGREDVQIRTLSTIGHPRFSLLAIGLYLFGFGLAPTEAANTYYVATNGSDSNNGLDVLHPFATIQHAADLATAAGTNVYVRGGTYREDVAMQHSGTSTAPINFQAYNGEQVTVTGLDVVSGSWTSIGNSTYSRSMSLPAQSDVFANGNLLNVARWPNAGKNNPLRATYATVDSVISGPPNSVIRDAELPAKNWVGATIAVAMNPATQWATFRQPVTAQSGNDLSFTWGAWSNGAPTAGSLYYLSETRPALDLNQGWCYDSTGGKLYLRAPGDVNPAGQIVEARSRRYGLDFNGQQYVNVTGFRMLAAGVKLSGQNNVVDHCQVLHPAPASSLPAYSSATTYEGDAGGFEVPGNHNTVQNSEIAYGWGSGILIQGGSNNTIHNNVIHDVDWSGNFAAGVNLQGTGGTGHDNTISNNTIYNTGRDGIFIPQGTCNNTRILNNDISRFGYLTKDLGGIYAYYADSSSGQSIIAQNRIHDNRSSGQNEGIYMDQGTTGFTAHHNVVSSVSYALQRNTPDETHPANNVHFYNNTISGYYQAQAAPYPGTGHVNCNTNNNLAMGNSGSWYGSDTTYNMTVSDDPFVDSARGDYRLRSGTAPVNAGKPIAGITPDGNATPDVGAFQSGETPWTAGADFKAWTFGNQRVAPLATVDGRGQTVSVTWLGNRDNTSPLSVGQSSSDYWWNNRRAFMKFDLSGLSGISSPITKAVLRLYESAMPDDGTGNVNLYKVTSTWTDTNVSYNQSVGESISGWYDSNNLDLYTDIDITQWVQGWLNAPSSNYGLSLRSTVESTAGSAKWWDGYYGVTGPQLIITAPEPGALVMLLAAAIGALAYAWRRRKDL
jgi:hypothetical protein